MAAHECKPCVNFLISSGAAHISSSFMETYDVNADDFLLTKFILYYKNAFSAQN